MAVMNSEAFSEGEEVTDDQGRFGSCRGSTKADDAQGRLAAAAIAIGKTLSDGCFVAPHCESGAAGTRTPHHLSPRCSSSSSTLRYGGSRSPSLLFGPPCGEFLCLHNWLELCCRNRRVGARPLRYAAVLNGLVVICTLFLLCPLPLCAFGDAVPSTEAVEGERQATVEEQTQATASSSSPPPVPKLGMTSVAAPRGLRGPCLDDPDCRHKASTQFKQLFQEALGAERSLVSIRRALHRFPELAYREYSTSDYIAKTLSKWGIRYTTGWGRNLHDPRQEAGTGIVASIGTGQQPCVALRADIDALPIDEETPVDFRSSVKERMHACGHDAHTTMLLGAALLLKQREGAMTGTVKLIFQPAEEGGAGAKMMMREGVLEKEPAMRRIFGFHVAPFLPSGVLATRKGALMAGGERFQIHITGRGGHAAMPSFSIDPIPAAAAIIASLNTVAAREVSHIEDWAGIISVTEVQSGTTHNVIPSTAYVGGTVRALTPQQLKKLRGRVVDVAKGVAAAHRCTVSVDFATDPYPPLLNDDEMVDSFIEAAHLASLGNTDIQPIPASLAESSGAEPEGRPSNDAATLHILENVPPVMGGEDFAFYGEQIPSAFAWLGIGGKKNLGVKKKLPLDKKTEEEEDLNAEPAVGRVESSEKTEEVVTLDTSKSLHNPKFAMDEKMLKVGAALHAFIALRAIDEEEKKLGTGMTFVPATGTKEDL